MSSQDLEDVLPVVRSQFSLLRIPSARDKVKHQVMTKIHANIILLSRLLTAGVQR